MAKARPIPGIGEEDAFATVAARVVELRARELAEHADGVLDVTDIERVHDMRVATRRLRAALEVFEPCFPRKRLRAALREVKALADALGERRDRDVTLEELDRYAAGIGAADRPGVRSLAAQLRAEQAEVNLELAPSVSADRIAALGERLMELVAAADALVEVPADEAPTMTAPAVPAASVAEPAPDPKPRPEPIAAPPQAPALTNGGDPDGGDPR
jgi:CHAD domain-containing protein